MANSFIEIDARGVGLARFHKSLPNSPGPVIAAVRRSECVLRFVMTCPTDPFREKRDSNSDVWNNSETRSTPTKTRPFFRCGATFFGLGGCIATLIRYTEGPMDLKASLFVLAQLLTALCFLYAGITGRWLPDAR